MQKVLICVLVAACGPSDDASESEVAAEEGPQTEDDQEICDNASVLECPPGFGYEMIRGSGHLDLTVIDLFEEGVAVCGDRGVFVPPSALEGVDRVGFDVTRNSVCTFGCFGGCSFWGACFAVGEEDASPCVHECAELTEEQCAAFVRDCVGQESCEVDGPG